MGKDSKVVIGTTKIGGQGHGFRASQDLNLNDPQRDIRDKVYPYSYSPFIRVKSELHWFCPVLLQLLMGSGCHGAAASLGSVEESMAAKGVVGWRCWWWSGGVGGVGAGSGESATSWRAQTRLRSLLKRASLGEGVSVGSVEELVAEQGVVGWRCWWQSGGLVAVFVRNQERPWPCQTARRRG